MTVTFQCLIDLIELSLGTGVWLPMLWFVIEITEIVDGKRHAHEEEFLEYNVYLKRYFKYLLRNQYQSSLIDSLCIQIHAQNEQNCQHSWSKSLWISPDFNNPEEFSELLISLFKIVAESTLGSYVRYSFYKFTIGLHSDFFGIVIYQKEFCYNPYDPDSRVNCQIQE